MDIPVGAKGRAEMTVTSDKTAAAIGSGSVEVFATVDDRDDGALCLQRARAVL